MKKILVLTVLIFTLATLATAYAQENELSPSSSPTPVKSKSDQNIPDKIQELKDKVASRVAALKKEKISAISGSIKSASDTALIIVYNNSEYSIQLDEEAKVYTIDEQLRKKEVKLNSFEKEQQVVIIGVINHEEKTAVAKVVVRRTPALSIVGRVESVSTKDGIVTVVDRNGKTYKVDVEISTKSNLYDFTKGALTKIGLSKIEEGAKIHVYATAGNEENRITAVRILILPELAASQPTSQPTPTKSGLPKEPSPTK